MDLILPDPAATIAAGERLAATLQGGEVIALCGGLGAGKTHFAKGILIGLGGADEATSPTFTLVHEYRSGRRPLFHFDFYRIERPEEVISLGWDDYLDSGGVCVVEWADRFTELLPPRTQWLELRHAGQGRELRRIAPGGGVLFDH